MPFCDNYCLEFSKPRWTPVGQGRALFESEVESGLRRISLSPGATRPGTDSLPLAQDDGSVKGDRAVRHFVWKVKFQF